MRTALAILCLTLSAVPLAAIPADDNTEVRVRVAMAMAEEFVSAPSPTCRCPSCSCENCTCDGGVCKCEACIGAKGGWLSYAAGFARPGPKIVVVTTDACVPCKALEAALANVDLTGYVTIKVNAAREPELAGLLMASSFPRLIVYGADAQLRGSYDGAMTPDQIRDALAGRVSAPAATPYLVGPAVPASRAVFFAAPVRRGGC